MSRNISFYLLSLALLYILALVGCVNPTGQSQTSPDWNDAELGNTSTNWHIDHNLTNGRRLSRSGTASKVELPREEVSLSDPSQGYFTQRWSVYFSNPRAASIFLTPRIHQFGTGRFHFIPILDGGTSALGQKRPAGVPAARWMMSLLPREIYKTSRGQAMNRFVAFLMPPSLVLRKLDGFGPLWAVTHDLRTVPMVVADEYCEPMFTGELVGGGGWRGPVLRNYWDDSVIGERMKYVPLGPRFEFKMVAENELKLPLERKHLFNMMASLDTNAGRQALQARLTALIAADDAAPSIKGVQTPRTTTDSSSRVPSLLLAPLRSGFIHNAKEWTNAIPTAVTKGMPVPTSAYRDVLLDSVFTLCPQGHSPETFRLFEAAEAGSIPIVEIGGSVFAQSEEALSGGGATNEINPEANLSGACVNPWRPFLESQAPFIWVKDWADVDNILTVLAALPQEKVAVMQLSVQNWYTSFMKASVGEVEQVMRGHLSRWLVEKQEAGLVATSRAKKVHSRVPAKALADIIRSNKAGLKSILDPAVVERLRRAGILHEVQQEALLQRWRLSRPSSMIYDKKRFFLGPSRPNATS